MLGTSIELHGGLDRVRCLGCDEVTTRDELRDRLLDANADWEGRVTAYRADGDVALPEADVDRFRTVDCRACGGVLKPDVVFFGENVPRERVAETYAVIDEARALLVLGSSLTVMSGRRFVLHAAKRALSVAIVNQGVTRGDPYAAVRVDGPLGTVLPALVRAVVPGGTDRELAAG